MNNAPYYEPEPKFNDQPRTTGERTRCRLLFSAVFVFSLFTMYYTY